MALSGSLDDFNILNILQMIKLEGKTGRLALTEGDDQVKITFDGGAIIYAEATPAMDEARIRETLLSNNMIPHGQWEEIRREHEDKLRPFWELLAKRIDAKLVLELIRRQVIDNVYFALRWKIGQYEFSPMKSVKYNSKVMTPMDVDGLLMEGCRIADEWPRLMKAVPPMTAFIVKNILGEEEDDTIDGRSNVVIGGAWEQSLERELLDARGVNLTKADIAALSAIGDGKTLENLLYAARQGQYDTMDSVARLLASGVLKIAEKKSAKLVASDLSSTMGWLVVMGVLALIVAGGAYWQLTSMQAELATKRESLSKVKVIQARIRLREIERELSIYSLLKKGLPQRLDQLVEAQIANRQELLDPWNNEYRYRLEEGGFVLYSEGQDKVLREDNVYPPRTLPVDAIREMLKNDPVEKPAAEDEPTDPS